MIEYAVLALLAFRSLNQMVGRYGTRLVVGLTFLVLGSVGVVDETLQRHIPGRHSDWRDYLADLAGGILVLVVLWWLRRIRGSPGT
jgi:VanZ family protein